MACLQSVAQSPAVATTARRAPSHRLLPPPSALAVALLVVAVLAPSFFQSPQCHPGPTVSDELAAASPPAVRRLNRRESTTGVITVTENLIDNEWARLLRCDHSLLGGLWIGQARRVVAQENGVRQIDSKKMDAEVLQLSDSVYATFLIQEAVRLVDRHSDFDSNQQTALIM
jgi:hypothetical protein